MASLELDLHIITCTNLKNFEIIDWKFTSFYKQTSVEQTESRENESKFMMNLCRKFEDIIGSLRKFEGDNSRKKKEKEIYK